MDEHRLPAREGGEGWGWRASAFAGALVVVTIAAFWPALLADFVSFDDPKFVTENVRIRSMSADNLRWMLTENSGGHWHPLTWLSWAVDYQVWGGLKPLGFHLTNVLLHAACAVLVFAIARKVLGFSWRQSRAGGTPAPPATPGTRSIDVAAFFAAVVFAVHPLRVESVAWVTERRDVLSAVFLFGAVLAYLRSVRVGEVAIASAGWTLAAVGLLALSLLAKAWGMSFFMIALILDWYPLRRLGNGPSGWLSRGTVRVVVQKAPFVALGIGAAGLAAWAQSSAFATKTLEEWGVGARVVQAVYGLWFYVFKSFVPIDLCAMYELPAVVNAGEGRFVAAYAGLAVAVGVLVALSRKRPGLIAAAAVYGVMLAPVLGILQSGEQLVADRYSYLACVPLGMVAAAGALELVRRRAEVKAGLVVMVGVVIVAALGLVTFAQATTWQNGLTLWEQAYRVSPTPLVRLNYAQELYEVDRKEESVLELEGLVRDVPREGRAWFLLAEHYRDVGQAGKSEGAFRRAAETMPQAFMAHVNLGYLLLRQPGRSKEAVESFRAAVADVEKGGRRVVHPGAYLALGDALRRTGDTGGSRAAFTKALEYSETRADAERELKTLGK